MKILFVKLSSLGDIIHSFPAIYDLARNCPEIELHWLVEEGFAELAVLPRFVRKVHKVHLRKLYQRPFKMIGHIKQVRHILKQEKYDMVIDGQGLLKSVAFSKNIAPRFYGYDRRSARDKNASFFYSHRQYVDKEMHALERIRMLFSKSLNYSIEGQDFDYGLDRQIYKAKGEIVLNKNKIHDPFVFFAHGTTWATKHWPFSHWVDLATLLKAQGIKALVSYGNEVEKKRAYRIFEASDNVLILPKQPLADVLSCLSCAKAFVSVDTGLGHLAAALSLPGVALYGPTSAQKVGILGHNQISISGHKAGEPWYNKEYQRGFDSMANILAEEVYKALLKVI